MLFVCLEGIANSENSSSTFHIPHPPSKSEVEQQECNGCMNESNHCPPWYYPVKGGTCQFGSSIGSIVSNNPSTMQTALLYFYCMTSTNRPGSQRDVVGGCSISVPSEYCRTYLPLPYISSELNQFMCAKANRDGFQGYVVFHSDPSSLSKSSLLPKLQCHPPYFTPNFKG